MNEPLKDNSGRASDLKTVAYIYLAITILGLIAGLFIRFTLPENNLNIRDLEVKLYSKIATYTVFEILRMILFAINAVFFILWFKRAYYNAHQISNKTDYSINMAGFCWFIPLMNLFVPFAIAKNMLDISNRFFRNKNLDESDLIKSTPVDAWWAVFILSGIINAYINHIADSDLSNHKEVCTLFNCMVATFALHTLDSLTYIWYISSYSKAELKLKELENNDSIIYSSLTDKEV
ncbi:MAG TPA: DUF4328 domain-containing protein [Bacteroidia bacterium]